MDKCDNAALLLSEYLCHRMYKRLARNGGVHASIGKEAYINITWAYTLSGFVSRFLQRRIKGVESAGLWNWWQQFTESQYSTRNVKTPAFPPVRPSMMGNILLIFYILIPGLGDSIVNFICETKKQVTIALGEFIVALIESFLRYLRRK